jgi:DNA polymerase-3 subunit delta
MPTTTERALHKAIKSRSLDPVYYFFGDDDFLKDDAVQQLIAAAVDPATRDFNCEMRRGGDLDAESLETLLETLPMMAERRLVVIRDVTALKKAARVVLEGYLQKPAPDTVVVLTSACGVKSDRVLCERASAVEFTPLRGDRVPKWVAHHASTVLGTSITPAAAELLQSAVGTDLPTLASELDKLASYTSGGEIDEHAVADVVGVRRGETLGDLLDRVAERDAAGAVALVDHVLAQPKTTGVSVVMALSTQILAMAWARAMRDTGTPAGRLESELFAYLREVGGVTGRPWGEATRSWARTVDRWSARALDEALDLLLAADVALKDTRLSSDEQLVSSLVLAMCAAGAVRAAA